MKRCPHDDIVFCPLYIAAHVGGGHGCDDGKLDQGVCAVARGLDYVAAVAALDPKDVAVLRFREQGEAMRAQRRRNFAAMGLH